MNGTIKAAKNSILLKGSLRKKVRLPIGEPSIRKATQPSPDVVVSGIVFWILAQCTGRAK